MKTKLEFSEEDMEEAYKQGYKRGVGHIYGAFQDYIELFAKIKTDLHFNFIKWFEKEQPESQLTIDYLKHCDVIFRFEDEIYN